MDLDVEQPSGLARQQYTSIPMQAASFHQLDSCKTSFIVIKYVTKIFQLHDVEKVVVILMWNIDVKQVR